MEVQCKPGEYKAQLTCKTCEDGKYNLDGNGSSCSLCNEAKPIANINHTECVTENGCGENAEVGGLKNNQCYCKTGYAIKEDKGQLTCKKCDNDQVAAPDHQSCMQVGECNESKNARVIGTNQCLCANGHFYSGSLFAFFGCKICNDGSISKGDVFIPKNNNISNINACTLCQDQQIASPGKSECIDRNICTEEYGAQPLNSNNNQCTCKAGYQVSEDGASCTECPDGQTSTGGDYLKETKDNTKCSNCGQDKYASLNHTTCIDKNTCTQTSGAEVKGNQCVCQAGYKRNQQKNGCELCSPGTYKEQSGTEDCATCPENTFSEAGATACTPCSAETEINNQNNTGCICANGYGVSATGDSCEKCPEGSVHAASDTETERVACTPCQDGKVPNNTKTACVEPIVSAPVSEFPTGAVVGAIIGVLAVIAIAVAVTVALRRKKNALVPNVGPKQRQVQPGTAKRGRQAGSRRAALVTVQ